MRVGLPLHGGWLHEVTAFIQKNFKPGGNLSFQFCAWDAVEGHDQWVRGLSKGSAGEHESGQVFVNRAYVSDGDALLLQKFEDN